jgi:O-methyltransferase involved in polyketide biosynthesis
MILKMEHCFTSRQYQNDDYAPKTPPNSPKWPLWQGWRLHVFALLAFRRIYGRALGAGAANNTRRRNNKCFKRMTVMKRKLPVELGNVQKTLLLPLWGRAIESRKISPLFVDKKAVEIIDELEHDFDAMGKGLHELTRAAWVIRCLQADTVIKQFLEKYPSASIVNIGCGLDTTFSRVDNGQILWYDLDLADVIELRHKLVPNEDRQKGLPFSLFDYDRWLPEIPRNNNVFLLSLGVLYYFDEDSIKGFFQRMAGSFPGAEMFFDVSSPFGVKVANKLVIKNSGMDERSFLKWGCKDARTIASWDDRIEIVKVYPFFAGRKYPIKSRFKAFISDALKVQYLCHVRFKN